MLVGVGVVFLLDQLGVYPARKLWHYAPLLMVVAGINQTIGYPDAKEFAGGVWTVCVGLWIFAVLEGLFGLTWGNSWPLAIVFSGFAIVLRPIAARMFNRHQENGHGQ
jgi:hypothetical protein